MKLNPPQEPREPQPREPRRPRLGDRERERETRYADWEGIQPLSKSDVERSFRREDETNLQYRTLRADPRTRDRIQAGTQRLERSMAIETGVIEGLFNPTHGVTQTLLREGFREELVRREEVDVEPAHLVAVLNDHQAAADMIYSHVREDRPITKHAMRELHAQITAHQETHTGIDMLGRRVEVPMKHGVFKDSANNPTRPDGTTHLYAPPEQVDPQLDLLLEQYADYEANHHPLLTGAWLHHRFIQIHPFADGNGRTGRVLLNWHLIRNDWLPLLVQRQDRAAYLNGMEQADAGNLAVLVDFFVAMSRKSIRMTLTDFPVEERLQVLGPENPDFEYRKEDGWRNGV